MILNGLTVRHFRRFAHFSLSLTPGLNVIFGPNEAGKSTLHDALLIGLFHKPNSRSADILNNQSWFAESLPEIVLEFSCDGQVFSLTKDFGEKSVVLTNCSTGAVYRDWSSVASVVEGAIGLSSALMFKATAFVEQGAMEAMASARDIKKGIGDELQKVVTGGGEDVVASAVLKKLDDRIAQLQRGLQALAKEPGEIRAARDKLQDLETRIATGREALSKVAKAEDALKADGERLAAMQGSLEDRRKLLALCEKRQQVVRDLDELRQKEEELDRRIEGAKGVRDEIAAVEKKLARYDSVKELDSTMLGRMAGLEEAVSIWQQHLQDEDREIAQLEVAGAEAGRAAKKPWLLVGGPVLVALGLVGALVNINLLAASLVGIALVALYFVLPYQAKTSYSEAIGTALGRQRYSQSRLDDAEEERQATLRRFAKQNYQQALESYEARNAILTRRSGLLAKLDGLLSEQKVEALEKERRRISRQKRDKEEALAEPGLVGGDLDPLSVQRLIRETGDLEASIAGVQQEIMRSQAIIDTASISLVDVHRLEEEQFFWQSQLTAAERKLAVYRAAREGIEAAKNSVLFSAKDVLEREMGSYLNTITGGRYRQVSVDEKTLDFAVYSPDKNSGTTVDPRLSLSRGAQDQMYLAARLSLVELICGGKKPPIILDDPFATFDESRLENTMGLCRELAKEHQILLFTCDRAYAKWADNLITLPGTDGAR